MNRLARVLPRRGGLQLPTLAPRIQPFNSFRSLVPQARLHSSHSASSATPWSTVFGVSGIFVASVAMASGCVTSPVYADGSVEDAQTPIQKIVAVIRMPFMPFIDAFRDLNETLCGDQSILLPPQVPDPYGRPVRTVCVNLEKTLVYPMWTRDYGWVVRKRPYVNMFLERLARSGYEVVLFSDSNQFDCEHNVMDLDPMGVFRHKLFKDATNFKHGAYVKDLSRLGRDLRSVILVDHNYKDSAQLQPDNAVHITPFADDLSDKELYRVLVLLENIQKYNVHDVRTVIKKYNENPDINHFEAEEKRAREMQKQLEEEEGVAPASARASGKKKGGGGWGGLFGRK